MLPQAVHTGGHEIVHQVVARRDRAEHGFDPCHLLALGHLFETEGNLPFGIRAFCFRLCRHARHHSYPVRPRLYAITMPELPEVETVRRGLAPVMEGRTIVSLTQNRADLRFPFPERFAERVSGHKVVRLGRRAKFLTVELSSGEVLVMHLGMTGRFTVSGQRTGSYKYDTGTDPAHDHVVIVLDSHDIVTYNDPRRFGFMELWPAEQFQAYPRLTAMGPEPLSNHFSAAYLDTALKGKKAPIKAALLDQSVIAGLGNIYVCEALWRARISPKRLSQSIPGQRAARLAPPSMT